MVVFWLFFLVCTNWCQRQVILKLQVFFFKAYSNFWHKILATFFFSYSIFSPDLLAKIKRSEFVPSAKGSVLVQLGLALVPYSCWGWLVAQSPLFLVILDPKMSPFRVYLWSPSHHKLVLIGNSSWNRAKLLGFFFFNFNRGNLYPSQ